MITYERKRDGYYVAIQNGRIVGALETSRYNGRTVAQVGNVEPELLGQGIGSKLYALALQDACEHRAPLTSDVHRSVFSEGWWRSQARRRRAVCVRRGPGATVYRVPADELRIHFFRECMKTRYDHEWASGCAAKKLQSVLDRLPKPKKSPRDGGNYWPCEWWQVPLTRCSGDRSLSGLRRRR